jgi:DNA-binding transcriptional LysR family regulator
MNKKQQPRAFDWTFMRTFLAVLERGTLLGAARVAGLSQPTVGRHITELERQLGVVLFERTGRGLLPTKAALGIAQHARSMASGADAVSHAATGQRTEAVGSVRITASQWVAAHLLPALLKHLHTLEPAITIDVVASNASSNLLRREADIAIRMFRPAQESLIARRIAHMEYGVYASVDYLRERGVPKALSDLIGHDLIGLDQDDSMLRTLNQMGLSLDRNAFGIRSDDFSVLWHSLCAGCGLGFAPCFLGDGNPSLRRVLQSVEILSLPVWLAVHREIRTNAAICSVYGFLARALPAALA